MARTFTPIQPAPTSAALEPGWLRQSYHNILYCVLALPLGVAYTTIVLAGVSLGFGLLVIWVGVPVLLLLLATCRRLISFERRLAADLLLADLPEAPLAHADAPSLWHQFAAYVRHPLTWRGLVYLMLKLPFGIFAVALIGALAALTIALLATPLVYEIIPIGLRVPGLIDWRVTDLSRALMCACAGVGVGVVSLQIVNALTDAWRRMAESLIGAP